ncbi:MAG: NosD domain-containing protein [Thermoplasmata archaeon]
MDKQKDRIKAYVCVLLVMISGFFVVIEVPHFPSEKDDIFLVSFDDGESIDRLSDLEVIATYEQKALLRGDEKEKRSLIERGFEINNLPSRKEIFIRGYNFDIEEGPDISPDMEIDGYESGQEGLYLIHMLGPIDPEWRREIEDQGVEFLNYVPNYAYEVRMTPEQAERVKDKSFVDWIGLYHPAYKIPEDIDTGTVNAKFVSDPERQIRENTLKTPVLNSRELENGWKELTLNVSSTKELKRWAHLDDLYSLSNRIEPELHSEVESQVIGGGIDLIEDDYGDPDVPYRKYGDFGAYINQMGYSGDGVTIAIADTGIGDGTIGDSGHPDLTERVKGGYAFGELDQEDWADGHGHGTHVTGSAAGDTYHGSGEDGEYPGFGDYLMGQGLAYNSELYSVKMFSDAGTFLLQDDNFYPIFEKPKQESDAYIHSNSWGASTGGKYTDLESVFDQAVRDANRETDRSEPMVITVSAGNSGPIEQTTGSPGNAKNVITVGATETYMPDGNDYGGGNSHQLSSIAGFSSRGWTEDNRVKPDVVAPGKNVLSLGSSSIFDGPTYDWKSGTSMSNPAVAGAASIVVEWYEEKFNERPSPAMVKALLINTAEDLKGDGYRSQPIPNKDEGWGMVDISKLEYPKDSPIPFSVEDQSRTVESGESQKYEFECDDRGEPLKITLAWTDKNAESEDHVALKNDLNLKVTSPSGKTYRGNAFSQSWTPSGSNAIEDFDRNGDGWDDANNVENVYIRPGETEDGKYSVEVEGFNIPEDGTDDGSLDQDYALTVFNSKSSELKTTDTQSSRRVDSQSIRLSEDNEDVSEYSEINPIHIKDDEEFETKVEQNGWLGSGTEEDPFLIEGYAIDGGEKSSPIFIEDVDSHFIIRDNRLYNANRSRDARSGTSGIYLADTKNGLIIDNKIELNSCGILLENSSGNTIEDNRALNNHVGIHLSSSEGNTIENNSVGKSYHPVYGHGIFLDDSNNNDITGNSVINSDEGILLENSDENLLKENNASFNSRGLKFEESNMNQVNGMSLYKNRFFGIYMDDSEENEISYLHSFNNVYGAYIRSSEKNLFLNNNMMHNRGTGMMFFSSKSNRVSTSNFSDNGGYGLTLFTSQNHSIYNNRFNEGGINLRGRSIEYWNTHFIPDNNTLSNGKRIYYLKNIDGDVDEDGAIIEEDAGQILIANSTNLVIKDKEIESGKLGVTLGFSEGNEIVNNTLFDQSLSITLRYSDRNVLKGNRIKHNYLGLYMVDSDKNTISENNISHNQIHGAYLSYSEQNIIFGNEFYNNDIYGLYVVNSDENKIYHNDITRADHPRLEEQSLAYDTGGNIWDHKMEGNYWSNYAIRYPEAGEAPKSGFWNISYEIMGDSSKDRYPLIDTDPVDGLSVSIIDPRDKDMIFSSEVDVRWALKGGKRNVDAKIRLDGGAWIDVRGMSEYTFEDLDDGYHTVEVIVEDDEETASHSVEFKVETDVFVEIKAPRPSSIERRSKVRVEWKARNMEYSEIRLEGRDNESTEWRDVGTKTEYTFSDLKDGDYKLSVRAVDGEGYIKYDSVGFSVRKVELEIKGPDEAASINSRDVTVEWTSQNTEEHFVSIRGGRWNRAGTGQKYNLTDLREGEYEVYVRAADETGKVVKDNVTFTVDVTEPVIQILEPKNGESLSEDNIRVRWEGYDDGSGVEKYEVRIDGGEWIEVGKETKYLFDGLEEGEHTIEVRVWDEAGNNAVDSMEIKIEKDSFSERLRENWWIITTIVAIAIIVLFDKIFWRPKEISDEGKSLSELERELGREKINKREDKYEL